jgi:omega-amidase
MKVHGCQFDIAWENKPENFAKARALLMAARPGRGDLFVLPEMFATGFSMNVEATSERTNPGGEEFLRETAVELGIFMLAGVANHGPDGKGLNQAVLATPEGDLTARYSKIHPFSLGGELNHYSRGTSLSNFQWNGLKAAPFICYDLRFPEIFRAAADDGAEMFVVIANWPAKRAQHWVTLLQARAIENLAYVVGVNRSGNDPSFPYPGRSMIIDPHGNVLADAGAAEGVISAEIEKSVVTDWRRDFPALRDRHWNAGRND